MIDKIKFYVLSVQIIINVFVWLSCKTDGLDITFFFTSRSVVECFSCVQYTCIFFRPFTVMVGSLYGFPGAGWCTTSVFFVLIVS